MNFEITKREVFASISLILIILAIGFGISSGISNNIQEQNEIYNKALKIDNQELFEYAVKTNAGNVFTVFQVESNTPQSIPDIDGQYMSIHKKEEHYVMKTRLVTKTRTKSDGTTETYTETETYWEWDVVDNEYWETDEITLNNITFPISRVSNLPWSSNGGYQYNGSRIRFSYYTVPVKFSGSMYVNLNNREITDKRIKLNCGVNPEELYVQHHSSSTGSLILFWVLWVALSGFAVYGFMYLENRWLNN